MKIEKFGNIKSGEEAKLFTLENKNGMIVKLTDIGGQLVNVQVPDKNGVLTDCILGSDSFDDYEMGCMMFGGCVGRNANRIARGEFEVGGKTVRLYTYPNNICHSGPEQWITRIWNTTTEEDESGQSVTFFMRSPDGDQGYPGNMDVEITYTLTNDNELILQFYGVSDQDTIFNMTNHTYFNLNGAKSDALNHRVTINADYYLPTDEGQIPTGELKSVEGTPFDFRTEKRLGQDIDADDADMKIGRGYDHNFVINGGKVAEDAEFCAKAVGDLSGIVMEVFTDRPGVQLFTMNWPAGRMKKIGRNGIEYGPRYALCLETQFAPDAVHQPEFASPLIKANEESTAVTIYRFSVEA